jgi:hypothetical protein
MTRRLVAAIAAVLAMLTGLAVAAAPFGLAVQRAGHWSRPTVVNVATGGGIALVGLLGFLFAVAGLVSNLRHRGLLGPARPLPPPPPPLAPTAPAPTRAPQPAPTTTRENPEPPARQPTEPVAGAVEPVGEEFPRRPTLQRDGVLGSEWDGFLQPRTASPADLIQGVRAARDPDRDRPPQPTQPVRPSLASPPPGVTGAVSNPSPAGARPYTIGPYRVGRAPGAGAPDRPVNGVADQVIPPSQSSRSEQSNQSSPPSPPGQTGSPGQAGRPGVVSPPGQAGVVSSAEQPDQGGQRDGDLTDPTDPTRQVAVGEAGGSARPVEAEDTAGGKEGEVDGER